MASEMVLPDQALSEIMSSLKLGWGFGQLEVS